MKFNKELQESIERECEKEIAFNPYILTEYDGTFADIDVRSQIYTVVSASHAIGLDLTPLQAFQIWGCLSADFGCSGWMSVSDKVQSLLEYGIKIYLKNSIQESDNPRLQSIT